MFPGGFYNKRYPVMFKKEPNLLVFDRIVYRVSKKTCYNFKLLLFPNTSLQLPNWHTLRNHQCEFKKWPVSFQTDEKKNLIKKWPTFFSPDKTFPKRQFPSREQYEISSLLNIKHFQGSPLSFQREMVRLKNNFRF